MKYEPIWNIFIFLLFASNAIANAIHLKLESDDQPIWIEALMVGTVYFAFPLWMGRIESNRKGDQ